MLDNTIAVLSSTEVCNFSAIYCSEGQCEELIKEFTAL